MSSCVVGVIFWDYQKWTALSTQQSILMKRQMHAMTIFINCLAILNETRYSYQSMFKTLGNKCARSCQLFKEQNSTCCAPRSTCDAEPLLDDVGSGSLELGYKFFGTKIESSPNEWCNLKKSKICSHTITLSCASKCDAQFCTPHGKCETIFFQPLKESCANHMHDFSCSVDVAIILILQGNHLCQSHISCVSLDRWSPNKIVLSLTKVQHVAPYWGLQLCDRTSSQNWTDSRDLGSQICGQGQCGGKCGWT